MNLTEEEYEEYEIDEEAVKLHFEKLKELERKKRLKEEELKRKIAIQKELESKKKLSIGQAKKKFRIDDKISEFIFNSIKDKNVTANQISQKTNKTIANISDFLRSQGIRIKRY